MCNMETGNSKTRVFSHKGAYPDSLSVGAPYPDTQSTLFGLLADAFTLPLSTSG